MLVEFFSGELLLLILLCFFRKSWADFPVPQRSVVRPRDEERLAHGGIFTKCGYKKTPGKNHSHREFFICIVKRNTFGLERQIVLGITRSKFRSSGRSRRRNGSTRSHWSTCAYTLHFPCTDTVEPTVVPLAGVNVE